MELIERWRADGSAVLIDVHEDFEYAAEHIEGAHNHPLSTFDPAAIRAHCGDKRIVFHCRSGKRSAEAAVPVFCQLLGTRV